MFCKVVFYPTRSNPRWWYVIQTAPCSRHIFDEGGIDEVLPEQAMDEEIVANEVTSVELHPTGLEGEGTGFKEESSRDDSSNKSIQYSSDDNDDMATSNSVKSTSLGINLELVLEISKEDMLMDEVSTPWDE